MASKDGCQNHLHVQHTADQVNRMATRHIMQDVQGDIHYMWLCNILLVEYVHMAFSLSEKRALLCSCRRYHRLVMVLSTKIS